MHISLSGARLSSIGVLACSIISAAAYGQADANRIIDEVIVTAQKRSQSLQDVAVAVSAFTGDTLETRGIGKSNELATQVPNLAIATNGGPDGAPVFYIRGVGLTDFSSANSGPVGVYQDEVYLKSLWAQNFALFDLSQIEVLRGPQGTLFGRNTTAGAMLFVSQRPSEEFEGRLRLDTGSFGMHKADLALGGQLVDGVSGRLALQYSAVDGFIDNEVTGNSTPETEKWSYRGILLFDLTDALTITTKYQGGKNTGTSSATKGRGLFDPATGAVCSLQQINSYLCANALGTVNTNSDKTVAANDFEPDLDINYNALMLRADWDLSDSITLTSISSFDKIEAQLGEDADATIDDILTVYFDDESEQFSQELRLSGASDTDNWVLGAYYLRDETKGDSAISLFGALAPFVLLPEELTGISDASTEAVFSGGASFTQETDSFALFGQYERSLTDALRLTLGLRYTAEDIELRDYQTIVDFPGLAVAPGLRVPLMKVPLVTYSDTLDDEDLSGKIGLDYYITEDLMVYGMVSTAFKAGGFNTAVLTDPFQARPYDAEEVIAYEAGLKSTLLEGRMQLNAAVFFYDYSDAQVFTNISSSAGVPATLLTNAPESEMYGFEAELTWKPIPGMNIQSGVGYVNSELIEFRTEEVLGNGDILVTDLSGNTTPVTPEWNFNVLATYEWELDSGTVIAQADYSWQDDIFFSSENIDGLSQEAYGLLNARLTFQSASQAWSVGLWGRNLTDEEYRTWSSDVSDFGTYSDYWGIPRSAGVDLLVEF